MQKKRRLIPFSWLPASWGLKGSAYKEAEANYYYEGKDLALKLAEIRFECEDDDPQKTILEDSLQREILNIRLRYKELDSYQHAVAHLDLERVRRGKSGNPMEGTEYSLRLLEIDYNHGKISAYECDCKQAELENPDKNSLEYQLAKLDVDLKHEKITQNEHDKKVATLKEEPWIGIVDQGFDPEKGIGGVYFEFDWNEYWIIFLRMNGYHGHTEDQIIDQWFSDVCRSQNIGVNEFGDDGSVIPFNGRIVNRTPPQG